MNEKLLALTMIVGEGEAELLERCLQSVKAEKVFDEIFIVQTHDDPQVWEVANKYTDGDNILIYQWRTERYPYGDFGGARNAGLEKVTCKYWMWLDADDIVDDSFAASINELKNYLRNGDIDVYTVPYNLFFDKKGNVTTKLDRERIIRTRPDIFWQYPIHEQISVDVSRHKRANIERSFCINHHPIKDHTVSAGRNLKILEHECSITSDGHLQYYLARECWNSKQYERATELFKELLNRGEGGEDSLAVAALKIAEFYLYDNSGEGNDQLFKETLDEAETYCRISFAYSNYYAEPYVYLGDIYSQKQDYPKAMQFYKQAMKTQFDGTGIKDVKFYGRIPAFRLCQLSAQLGNFEDALVFSKIVLNSDPTNEQIHIIRKGILKEMIKQYKD